MGDGEGEGDGDDDGETSGDGPGASSCANAVKMVEAQTKMISAASASLRWVGSMNTEG